MLELGEESENAHIALSTVIKLSAFSVIFLFGDQIKITAKKLDDTGFGKLVFWTNDFFKLRDEILNTIESGDVVLLKGSRGCKLERLIPILKAA